MRQAIFAYSAATLDVAEKLMPYDAVRQAASPDAMLLEFLHSTCAAAADLGKWNRTALETRPPPASALRR